MTRQDLAAHQCDWVDTIHVDYRGYLERDYHAGDEQFLVFNFGNPAALRDNVRQSAAELALLAHIVEFVSIDVGDCPGAVAPENKAHFDVTKLALMGHSMGAAIAPLTLAAEPRYRAVLMSGAGSSSARLGPVGAAVRGRKPRRLMAAGSMRLTRAGTVKCSSSATTRTCDVLPI